jgi:beta-RFAP synthase
MPDAVPAERPHARAHVAAPGRLHLGFLDPDGTLGRRFGSVGLAIDGPCTRVSMQSASRDAVLAEGDCAREADRAADCLARLRQAFGPAGPLEVCLHEVLPPHAGLGSGTQLALALARTYAQLHGLDVPAARLAAALDRGRRSGIGIAAFETGGLVVDAGPGTRGAAPVIARVDFPEAWRVLLVLDPTRSGRHGAAERGAFAMLPPLPRQQAAHLAHLVLMRLLPAAIEADFSAFAPAVSEVQRVIGAHFAPAQDGSPYTSPDVAALLDWIGAAGGAGIGQSSWGPTGFAIFPSTADAERAVDSARAAGRIAPHIVLRIVRGRNHGAVLA